MSRKILVPSAERNKIPILEVLQRLVPSLAPTPPDAQSLSVLEIAAGAGVHTAHFAKAFEATARWHPTDYDSSNFESIQAYIAEAAAPNVESPVFLDASKPDSWPFSAKSVHLVLNINMIHISPLAATAGLFQGSARVLKPSGLLVTYGPYSFNGVISPESNVQFDKSLKERNPEWGLRDVTFLKDLASKNGLAFVEAVDMPANNHILVFRKQVAQE